MLTATSTEFLLLSSQVGYLNESFNWVVGGIGIVVAIALGVIGALQFLHNKKTLQTELLELKKDLTQTILKISDEKALSLQAFTEESLLTVRKEMEFQRESLEGDIDRSYALKCEDKELHALAFKRWLKAASHYEFVGESDLVALSIRCAKESLEKIKTGDSHNIKTLWDDMSKTKEIATKLSVAHETEMELVINLMKEKSSLPEES